MHKNEIKANTKYKISKTLIK